MLKPILVALLLTSLASAHAAAPGKAELPTDENSVEADLQNEDDGTPTPQANPPPKSTVEAPIEIKPSEPLVERSQEYRESGASGEKIFDWSKHVNETEVAHPYAEKGLIRISKDRTYYYKVDESPQTRAASLHMGMYDPLNLSNPDAEDPSKATFADNYDQSSNPAVLFEYEWQGWRSAIGKFGIRLGSGIFVAQGHGHFVHDYNANSGKSTPREIFTFAALPNSLGVVYRMHMWHKQLFVPYGEGGMNAFTFGEFRDDNKNPKFGGALAAYAAGGLALNLTYFDYLTRVQLDREYGINACYLTMEYRHIFALSQRYDFGGDLLNGGILVEY